MSLIARVNNRLYLLKKFLYQKLHRKRVNKKLVFVMGCQRSGTSMLMNIFYKDINIKTYKESESLFYGSGKRFLRLKETIEVEKKLKGDNVDVIVAKPLLDSQLVVELLNKYKDSRCIWIYRDYKDVAASNLKQFGDNNGHKDLAYIVANDKEDWRAEKVSAESLKVISELYNSSSSNLDSAALFWYVRNRIFFDNNLQHDSRVKLCKYEDLVSRPENVISDLYDFMGMEGFDKNVVSGVHRKSVSKGSSCSLNHEVDSLCKKLMGKLDEYYG